MRKAQSTPPSWQNILLLVTGVVFVVIIALLLAQMDTYLQRSEVPTNGLPIVDLEATIAAGELGSVYLPSEMSPTAALPASPTPTLSATPVQATPATAVPGIDSNCGSNLHGWSPYIVKAEDSLASLAQQSGLSENTIQQANCLVNGQIMAGQQIFLRRPTSWTDMPAKPSRLIATPKFSPSP